MRDGANLRDVKEAFGGQPIELKANIFPFDLAYFEGEVGPVFNNNTNSCCSGINVATTTIVNHWRVLKFLKLLLMSEAENTNNQANSSQCSTDSANYEASQIHADSAPWASRFLFNDINSTCESGKPTHPSSPASGQSGHVPGSGPANSAGTYKPVPSPSRTVPSPGASALGSFSLSSLFLQCFSVGSLAVGTLPAHNPLPGNVLVSESTKDHQWFLFFPEP